MTDKDHLYRRLFFGTTRVWINEYIFTFGWTIPSSQQCWFLLKANSCGMRGVTFKRLHETTKNWVFFVLLLWNEVIQAEVNQRVWPLEQGPWGQQQRTCVSRRPCARQCEQRNILLLANAVYIFQVFFLFRCIPVWIYLWTAGSRTERNLLKTTTKCGWVLCLLQTGYKWSSRIYFLSEAHLLSYSWPLLE